MGNCGEKTASPKTPSPVGLPGFADAPRFWERDTGRWTADPRISTRFDLRRGPARTTLKAAAGLFHQAPNPNESIAPWGTPGIKAPYAEHYSAGFEQEFGGAVMCRCMVSISASFHCNRCNCHTPSPHRMAMAMAAKIVKPG